MIVFSTSRESELKLIKMLILNRLIFAQSILINFRLCSSKIYLKPDRTFDLQYPLDSDFMPEKNSFIEFLHNDNLNSADKSIKLIKGKAIQGHKLGEINKPENIALYHLDIQETDSSDLDREEIDLDTEEDSDLEIDDLNLDNVQKSMLRKRWRSSCDKKASKTCTTACKNAYNIVCSSYKCKRKMKREFKKECRRNCKSKFLTSVSSIESDIE